MKTNVLLTGMAILIFAPVQLFAQEKNLIMNNSFEDTHGRLNGPGTFGSVENISSSNNTTIDHYCKDACGRDYDVPENYMGNIPAKTGDSYAGFIAYYADDVLTIDFDYEDQQLLKSKPGYRRYTEYIQFTFSEPLVKGQVYNFSCNISLAEKSAYAVSGIGIYVSTEKLDIQNNAFLDLTPDMVTSDILRSTEWTTLSGVYIAKGGENYLTFGGFDNYMHAQKIVGSNVNNSRKAYYFIDEVSFTQQPEVIKEVVVVPEESILPMPKTNEEITDVLLGSCYKLHNLNFETEKAVILPGSFQELEILAKFVKNYPYVTVHIDGHADKTGTSEYNDKLALERAIAVRDYLINEGVEESRIVVNSYGEKLPVDEEADKSYANRRVEITICSSSESTSKK